MVSHERICQYIREDKKKGGALCKHLRHRLKHRKRHKQYVHSITSDNGTEFYEHKRIAKYLDANYFFCSSLFLVGKRIE
jgi:IS30 family transposase